MGCSIGKLVPPIPPDLVGLWISCSDNTRNKDALLHNFKNILGRYPSYQYAYMKCATFYKACSGSVLEILPDGNVKYLEMKKATGTHPSPFARIIYSGPITSWDSENGVWTSCYAGCGRNGIVDFAVDHLERDPKLGHITSLGLNGRSFSKQKDLME